MSDSTDESPATWVLLQSQEDSAADRFITTTVRFAPGLPFEWVMSSMAVAIDRFTRDEARACDVLLREGGRELAIIWGGGEFSSENERALLEQLNSFDFEVVGVHSGLENIDVTWARPSHHLMFDASGLSTYEMEPREWSTYERPRPRLIT